MMNFKAQHPAAGAGFVSLAAKWKVFDPGGVLDAALIDAQRQMMFLKGGGTDQWAGRFQELPVPAVDETLEYAVYGRFISPGFINNGGGEGQNGIGDFGDLLAGMAISTSISTSGQPWPTSFRSMRIPRALPV